MKKGFHDISIHTDFHQNWSINKCARMILAKEVVLDLMKKLCLHNVDILKKYK